MTEAPEDHRFNPRVQSRSQVPEGEGAKGPLPVGEFQEEQPLTSAEVSAWLEKQRGPMTDRWLVEVRSRSGGLDGELLQLIGDLLDLFVGLLPLGLGAFRDQVESVLQQAAELYGNLGAHRGLAAGEAVEEIQLLRGVFLRFLYTQPPEGGTSDIGLRDLLQLNRLVDLAVTYASVGHTDILFFNLFHGTGVSGTPTPELLAEVREQMAGIREELELLAAGSSEEASRRPMP